MLALTCLLPFLALAGEDVAAASSGELEITNHALVDAVSALEQRHASFTPEFNPVIGRIAGLEADGPWRGNLTYRTEFVSGGPYDGFRHGVSVGLDYREHVADNLLLNIQMLFDSNNDLFGRQFQDGSNRVFLDEAYFKYSN